ncbi:CHAT domain-containing protein [Actinokineospora enzanensis]|uniref:CHAT domain-containing protein n=1 Tax=Actinokineospora enzanensis TaxID=155975 RepID=UPI000369C971|nr:CHAT domain-containing protein [Actinokineospora enzanensis]
MAGPAPLPPEHPAARHVLDADAAFARGDPDGVDDAYGSVPDPWPELAMDHVARLVASRRLTLARARCADYLDRFPGHPPLRLQSVEIASALGEHDVVRAGLPVLREADLGLGDRARLLRVWALADADRGDIRGAMDRLASARSVFAEAGADDAVAAVDRDRFVVAVRAGDATAAGVLAADAGPLSTADSINRARALKRQLRYEEALATVTRALADPAKDVGHRFTLLAEAAVLLRLCRQEEKFELVLPILRESATTPRQQAVVDGLVADGTVCDLRSADFDDTLWRVRADIDAGRPADAETALRGLRVDVTGDRDDALWHLAAGELEFARNADDEAARHFMAAVDRAGETALTEVRVLALRLLGRVHARSARGTEAAHLWAAAHRLEEHVAARQVSDEVRVGMLLAASDEYDERVRAAAAGVGTGGPGASAELVVAIEAARGATVLDGIAGARDLPGLGDSEAARRWCLRVTRGLPRSRVLWMMHAVPDRVHHVLVTRRGMSSLSVAVDINRLAEAVDELLACQGADVLAAAVAGGEFDAALDRVGALIGLPRVLAELTAGADRITAVAGGLLADVPLNALRGEGFHLGERYAITDLPCLSMRFPLRARAGRTRGDQGLLVRPPAEGLIAAADMPHRTVLEGDGATPAALRDAVATGAHRRIRLDAHGRHDPDHPMRSVVALAGPDGDLTADRLAGMDLTGCGTLMVGACESGMAQRRGRDEPLGFVRAALRAGAAAVVAARWDALDSGAAAVLDRFEHYLRYLPRDLALHRAHRDIARGHLRLPTGGLDPTHPAAWACWTLYGDPGVQTGAGPIRRRIRGTLDDRRTPGSGRAP